MENACSAYTNGNNMGQEYKVHASCKGVIESHITFFIKDCLIYDQ